jgi:hypothetical protein
MSDTETRDPEPAEEPAEEPSHEGPQGAPPEPGATVPDPEHPFDPE